MALVSGEFILYLKNAYGAQPALLITLMIISSIFAAAVGINNACWVDIATNIYILIGLIIALIDTAGFRARRALDVNA